MASHSSWPIGRKMPLLILSEPNIAVGAAFGTTVVCLWLGLRNAWLRQSLSDTPNERSLHKQVTPRFGGLGVAIGVLVGLSIGVAVGAQKVAPSAWLLWFIAAYMVLVLLSVFDDRQSLSAGKRMVVHLLVALCWAIAWSITQGASVFLIVFLVLAITWSMNLYNFMDGADGLAAGMAVIGFGTMGYAAWGGAPDGAAQTNLACVVLAASAAGFLVHNFPPARVFLGDAGSIPLGFSAAAIGMQGAQLGLWSPLFPFIVFFPFAFDATLTLLKRAWSGERVWQAHREHLYQKAVLCGMTHRAMTSRAYVLMGLCAGLALLGRNFTIWIETLIIGMQLAVGLALAGRLSRDFARQFARESNRS